MSDQHAESVALQEAMEKLHRAVALEVIRKVALLPDPLRREVIAKLSADYINGTHIDGPEEA